MQPVALWIDKSRPGDVQLRAHFNQRERKNCPEGDCFILKSFWKTGAGEGIRTLDPNLGKVVLYH